MTEAEEDDRREFAEAVEGLLRGDFTRLAPLFEDDLSASGPTCRVLEWEKKGWFDAEPAALEEALACACFLGRTRVVEHLLSRGVDLSAGCRTGMNGFHWAANRGQLETVRLLIDRGAPLEVRNMYGGTVLGTAVWSILHETRPEHLAIIEVLLEAGARGDTISRPTGHEGVDELLRRYSTTQ